MIVFLWGIGGYGLVYTINNHSTIAKIISAVVYGNFRVLIAIFIFYLFGNINVSYSKLINNVAAATFDVYLIHVSQVFKDGIFNKINLLPIMQKDYWFASIFFVTLFVFFALTCVGIIRKKIFKNIKNRIITIQANT